MPTDERPSSPSLLWRASSAAIMGATGYVSRAFLLGASHFEVQGLEGFLKLLDRRQDVEERQRGLLTVSNHVSIVDDPLIWGALPFRYQGSPDHLRWGLASHDLCFPNKALSTFFNLGQVLPTHRRAYSKHGGLFQPTVTETIRLLSRGPFHQPSRLHTAESNVTPPSESNDDAYHDLSDPFTTNHLDYYTTTGADSFPVPSAYKSRRLGWVHIFPEGKIHQHPELIMRYFKWGVARLILESDPCPDVVPMWIEGPNEVMHESRTTPRWVPRAGKRIRVTFGEPVDVEKVFGDLRRRWQDMCDRDRDGGERLDVGILSKALMYGDDAVRLRMECTMKVREEVLKLRRGRGWSDEDPKFGKVETWVQQGGQDAEGRQDDGSWVKDM